MSLGQIKNVSILVVGDIILDRYVFGDATRLSAEAPVPILLVKNEVFTLGGAANVAYNLKVLGCNVDLCGFLSDDEPARKISELCNDFGISLKNMAKSDTHSIVKSRVIAKDQHVVRYDKETLHAKDSPSREELNQKIQQLKDEYDVVIVSDYAKGTICQSTMDLIKAKFSNKKIIIDPKPQNSSLYSNVYSITPNTLEAVLMIGDSYKKTPEDIAKDLREKFKVECVILTLSEKGCLLSQKDKTCHFPAYNYTNTKERHHRIDVAGAGDTMISVFSACIGSGMDASLSLYIANVAAAIVVNKLGTSVCTFEELYAELEKDKNLDTI